MRRIDPHFPNAPQVFDAADKFKQHCLLNQESLFLDGQTLWTAEHFQASIDNYVKQPDVGDGGFYDKLASQLATCQALDVALMAELSDLPLRNWNGIEVGRLAWAGARRGGRPVFIA